jgi:hypothetical protein
VVGLAHWLINSFYVLDMFIFPWCLFPLTFCPLCFAFFFVCLFSIVKGQTLGQTTSTSFSLAHTRPSLLCHLLCSSIHCCCYWCPYVDYCIYSSVVKQCQKNKK